MDHLSLAFRRIYQIANYFVLLAIQVYFNLYPTPDEWFRIILLSGYMLISSITWIRYVEHKPLLSRLGISQQTIVAFTYAMTASILVLFTKYNFGAAALMTAGSMILPIFEELYFRANLLGSVCADWPKVNELRERVDRKVLVEGLVFLLLTSVGFAVVHDDVIQMILNGLLAVNYPILLLRFLFGFTIGGLYLYTRSFVVTGVFHIIYNLTYLIGHT